MKYKIIDVEEMKFKYIGCVYQRVVYLFNSKVDTDAVWEIVHSLLPNITEITEDEEGGKSKDIAEIEQSILYSEVPGDLFDELTLKEAVSKIGGEISDEEKLELLIKEEVFDKSIPLIFFDATTKTVSLISTEDHLKDVVRKYKNQLNISIHVKYKIIDVEEMQFQFIGCGYQKVVYLFNSKVDTGAVSDLVYALVTDMTEDEEGEEIRDIAEIDPSILYSEIAGDLCDELTFQEVVAKIGGEISDEEKFELLIKEDVLDNRPLIFFDATTKTVSLISTEERLKDVVRKYKNQLNIYIREYEPYGDY
jgi:ABC-type Na+ transport system ATPase subunit NatA